MINGFKQILRTATLPVCLLLAGTAMASDCTPVPDCNALGYTKTAAGCPSGGVKCPWDITKMHCADTPIIADPCEGITAVTVPSNATCTATTTTCPSKCTGWTCNEGYSKVGNTCKKPLSPLPNPGGCPATSTLLTCGGREYCCPASTGYSNCSQMNAGVQKCLVSSDNDKLVPDIF